MRKNKGYNEVEVLNKLMQRGIKLSREGILVIPKDEHIGIKTWGMIDFLKRPWVRSDK
jgi:hypothetical protein